MIWELQRWFDKKKCDTSQLAVNLVYCTSYRIFGVLNFTIDNALTYSEKNCNIGPGVSHYIFGCTFLEGNLITERREKQNPEVVISNFTDMCLRATDNMPTRVCVLEWCLAV